MLRRKSLIRLTRSFIAIMMVFFVVAALYTPTSPLAQVPQARAAVSTTFIVTGTTTFAVPADWNDNANMIEVIGAGGGGRSSGTVAAAGGGGGGGYSMARNVNMPESTTVTVSIGGTASAGANGAATYICNTQNSGGTCDAITDAAVVAGANGGTGATSATGGAGAVTANAVGTVNLTGGNGGTGTLTTDCATLCSTGGGGGAAGPRGAGANGGTGDATTTGDDSGAGGGGNGGGAAGAAGTASAGAGGNAIGAAGGAGTGSGSGGNATCNAGTVGGGGGGGDDTTGTHNGCNGGTGTEWDGTHGAGGGGGGSANPNVTGTQTGGNGALYGGGGGGGETGGTGAAGIVVITYIPTTVTPKTVFITSGTSWTVPDDFSSSNFVEVIAGGGGGFTSITAGEGGGGGGAYSFTKNVSLTAGGSVTVSISGTAAAGAAATDTYFNGASCSAATLCADGGLGASSLTGVAGGTAANSSGILRFRGGTGGTGNGTSDAGGGGGGAAGPRGVGATGGNSHTAATGGGGGGGGSNGGTVGGNSSSTTGGTAGTGGTGGGGGGAGGNNNTSGSVGSNGTFWTQTSDSATAGPGGGGGGAGDPADAARVGGNGGSYGGGGGGGGTGGTGAPGLIVVIYIPVAAVRVGTSGTQTANITAGQTAQNAGGMFTFVGSGASSNVTGITVTESGTVDGLNNLDNILLKYDSDTSAPYDCASESYSGSETQYGSTDTTGFSAADGTSAFTGSVAISATSTMCVYVILDVGAAASGGQTIELSINASGDVTSSATNKVGTFPVAISGTTTIVGLGISVSGTVYQSDETTAYSTGKTVSLRVNGTLAGTGDGGTGIDGTDASGNFSFTAVTAAAGDTITLYTTTTEKANTITITDGSTNATTVPLYQNHVVIRSDNGATAITILDILDYDSTTDNPNMLFDAVDATPDTLTVEDGVELHIHDADTFTPGGTITTSPSADGTNSNVDGDIHIDGTGTLSVGTNAVSVGGDWNNEGTFTKSTGQTTTFTATATAHDITDGGENFDTVVFNGSGGGWSTADATIIDVDLTMTAGTISGTSNLTVNGGDVTGDGDINLTGGIFLVDAAGSFGGATAWDFATLTFGDGSGATTTTSTGAGSVTVSVAMTIAVNQTLDAKGRTWTLSGTTGTPFTITGVFNDSTDTSTFSFTGNNAGGNTTVPASTAYNNITLNNGSETFATAGTTTLSGDLTVTAGTLSGTHDVTVNGGDVTGNGDINLTAGTFIVDTAGSFGGTTDWDFNNLQFGDGSGATTTTASGAGSITVAGGKTVKANQTLNAGSKTWNLLGAGSGSAPAYRNHTVSTSTTTTNRTPVEPTTAADDILVAILYMETDNAVTPPAGWSNVFNGTTMMAEDNAASQQFRTYAYWIRRGGSAPALTWTFASTWNEISITSFSGAVTSGDPFSFGTFTLRDNNSGRTYPDISGTTTNNNELLIWHGGSYEGGTSGTQPTGFTERLDAATSSITIADKNQAAAGATGTVTGGTYVGSNTGPTTSMLMGLRPVSSAPITVEASGVFTAASSTVVYKGNSDITIPNLTYNHLTFNPTLTGSGKTYTFSGATTIGGDFNINPDASALNLSVVLGGTTAVTGTTTITKTSTATSSLSTNAGNFGLTSGAINIATGGTLTANNSTINLTGTGNAFTATGAFTVGGSTIVYNNTTSANIENTTYNNLSLLPGSGTPTYTADAGTIAVGGNLTVGGGTSAVLSTSTNDPTITVTGDLSVATNGTFSGDASNVTVNGGDVTGDGTINFTGGTFTVDAAGNFGGATGWTFKNLQLGDGTGSTTTTATGAGSVTVSGAQVIKANQTLNAGSKTWVLSGTGGVPASFNFVQVSEEDLSASAGTVDAPAIIVTSGNLLLAWVKHEGGAQSISVAYSDGSNTFTPLTKNTHANNDVHGQWFYLASATGGSKTVRATFGASVTFRSIIVFEYSYSGTLIADAESATGKGTGTAMVSGSINTTGTDELVVCGYGDYSIQHPTAEQINGQAADGVTDVSGGNNNTSAWRKTFTSTLSGATCTGTITSAAWLLNIASFKAVGPLSIETNGVFTAATSTVQYTGSTATALATTFNNLTMGGTGTYTMPATTTTLKGNMVVTNNATVTKGAGNIVFAKGDTQTVTDNNTTKQDLGNVVVSASSGGGGAGWCNVSSVVCDTSWVNRKKITLNNSASGENLTNFPVLVQLSSGNIDYGKTLGAGQDIRFLDSDNSTALNYEIETWNESGTSLVWVKVPQIDLGSTTDYIWMYYNNTGATDNQSASSVWSNSYGGVWHLKETPTTSAASSVGGLTCTTTTMEAGDQAAAKINGGYVGLDGSTDYATCGDNLDFNRADSRTITAWINPSNVTGFKSILTKADVSSTAGWWFQVNGSGLEMTYVPASGSPTFENTVTSTIAASTWQHVAAVYDNRNITFYKNAVEPNVNSGNSGTTENINSADPLCIGCVDNQSSEAFAGGLDEVRFATVARSADWIEAEYLYSVDNTKYTYGTEEGQSSTSSTLTTGSDIKITTLTLDSGQTLDMAGVGRTLTLTSNSTPITLNGTIVDTDDTIAFVPSTSGTITVPVRTYYSVTVNGSGSTFRPGAGTLTLNGNLAVTAGTLDLNTSDPTTTITGTTTIDGTLQAPSANGLTIKGTFTNNGTFTHNNGLVTVSPALASMAIQGTAASSFYDFIATPTTSKTINFKNGITTSFSHAITIGGSNSSSVALGSTTPASTWTIYIDPAATVSITYVSVRDSACAVSTKDIPFSDTNSNGGNNGVCWVLNTRGGGSAIGGGSGNSSGGGTPVGGGATIVFRNQTSHVSNGSSNCNPGEPSGTASGDILLAFIIVQGNDTTPSLPAGWTQLYSGTSPNGASATGFEFKVGYIVRGGSAVATTFTNGNSFYHECHIVGFSGVDIANPIDSQSSSGSMGTAIHFPDPPSTTAVAANTMAVAGGINWVGSAGGGWTASTNYNVRSNNTAGYDAFLEARSLSSAGAENPNAISNGFNTSTDYWDGFTITLKPGSGGSGGSGGGDGSGGGGGILPQAFTASDATVLTTYDSNWNLLGGTFSINTNSVHSNSAAADTMARWNTGTFNDNQYAEMTVTASGTGYIGVGVRLQAGAQTGYGAYCNATDIKLIEWTNGSQTTTHYTGSACSVSDVIRLEVSGTSLTLKKNGTTLATVTDASISSGRPGIIGNGNSTTTRGDNFNADSIASQGGGGGGGGGGGAP